MVIKTIVVDLGGVYFTDGTKLAYSRILNTFQIKEVRHLFNLFSNSRKTIGRDIRLGRITIDEFEKEFVEDLDIPEDKRYLIRHLWFSSYIPNYKMDVIMQQLRKKYRVITFSGNIKERVEYLDERYDFLKYFDDTVFSYDYQMTKGQIEFYEEMTKHLDCEPHEALMIDDERKNNEKAKSLGLKTITYYYTEQLVDEFKKFNININL